MLVVDGEFKDHSNKDYLDSNKEIIRGQHFRKEHICLACKTEIAGDLTINISTRQDAGVRKSSLNEDILLDLKPGVSKIYVTLTKPDLTDQTPDWERILARLPKNKECHHTWKPTINVLKKLPQTLREADFRITAVLQGESVLAIEKGDTTSSLYGVAFDIGTTSIAAFLLDLNKGKTVTATSGGNPQRIVGADVISRIEYVDKNPDGGKFLQKKVIEALNKLIDDLLAGSAISREHIYESTIVGNTTMNHLLLGINPFNLAQTPFVPTIKGSLTILAKELKLNIPEDSKVYILPNIAGFIGSDTVGAILASGLHRWAKPCLLIDIGTNGEIVLGSQTEIVACSAAAGPALEGAQIKFGMGAADGAIEGVIISEAVVHCKVIGNTRKVEGICGSGLIQAVAQMLSRRIINPAGRIIDPEEASKLLSQRLAKRVRRWGDQVVFVLVSEDASIGQNAIYISQRDIRELQLAKGAIAAGIQILMKEMSLSIDEIDKVYLAGTFGSYIDRKSAKTLGLIPNLPLDKVVSIGNAAGAGSVQALASLDSRSEAEFIALKVRNIELSCSPDFQNSFVEAMAFNI